MSKLLMYNELQTKIVKPNFLSTPNLERLQINENSGCISPCLWILYRFTVYFHSPRFTLLILQKRDFGELLEMRVFIKVSPGVTAQKASKSSILTWKEFSYKTLA